MRAVVLFVFFCGLSVCGNCGILCIVCVVHARCDKIIPKYLNSPPPSFLFKISIILL